MQEFKYLHVQVRDVESENIFDHFEEVVAFIDEGRANGNVLLHWYVIYFIIILYHFIILLIAS